MGHPQRADLGRRTSDYPVLAWIVRYAQDDNLYELADFFAPGFEILFDLGHELVGDGAVDEAVIVAESEMDNGADGDGVVAVGVGDDERHFGDAADAHDGGAGLVDDGQAEDGSELAGIGDGEGGTFDVFRLELFGAGALAEIGDTALQAEEVEVSGVLEDGDDEAPVEGDGDAQVDFGVVADVFAFDDGVDDGPLLNRDDGGADEEGHEGEADAVALLESGFVFGAQIDDAGEIHFIHAVDVSTGAAGLDHVPGDQLAHLGHGNEIAGDGSWGGGCLGRCRGRTDGGVRRSTVLDEGQDVLLGDAAA